VRKEQKEKEKGVGMRRRWVLTRPRRDPWITVRPLGEIRMWMGGVGKLCEEIERIKGVRGKRRRVGPP